MSSAKRSFDEVNAIMTAPGAVWEMQDRVMNGRKLRTYKSQLPAIRDFWQTTKVFGKREYIIHNNERITYDQAHDLVDRYATLLYQRGVRKGDRVAVASRNLPEWILLWWATHSLGACFVAVNAWAPPDSLIHCLLNADVKLLAVDPERAQALESKRHQLKGLCDSFFIMRPEGQVPEGYEDLQKTLDKTQRVALPKVDIQDQDLATIFFTSGTTSLPKGVYATQHMFLSNRFNTTIAVARKVLRQGLDLPVPKPTDPQKCMLLTVPLFHVTGCHSFMQLATAVGGKLILMRKWDVDRAAEIVVKENVTLAGGVPHMALELVERVAALTNGKRNMLEGLSFGGGPASVRLPDSVEATLPGVYSSQGYGLTETSAVATSFSGQDYIDRPTSCGLPTPVTDLKIIDAEGKTLGPMETGEICIRGPQVALGYWKNEKASKESFDEEGWFKSGDVGHIDKEGFLYIADRAKDIIIRGGENIATGQVENALYADHRVKDAAVVPVPDPKLSELVAALVVLHPQHRGKVTEQDLMNSVAKVLPKHCVPAIIEFRDEMTRSAAGKTVKTEIKKIMATLWENRVAAQKQQQVKAKL